VLDQPLIFGLVKIAIVLGVIMTAVPMIIWVERKVVADVQARIGPNRVGKFGLLQSFADGIKLLAKENILPAHVDKTLYFLAPVVIMIPALALIAAIPFGGAIGSGPHQRLVIADLPVGLLYVLALGSLGVYGIVLAGWASNNKYSLLGGLRSSAQMISYELPMGLAVIGAILIAASRMRTSGNLLLLNLNQVVDSQAGGFWHWNLFWYVIPGLIAGVTFFICGMAETNRTPFDLPEAETELVAGYHTEYSSMKFAMFFMAEYANMVNVSALFTTLFLGGWRSPLPWSPFTAGTLAGGLEGVFWFSLKVGLLLLVFIWARATLPRLRYDQLMAYAWKRLTPVALVNLAAIALVITAFSPRLPIPDNVKTAAGIAEPRSAVPENLAAPASGGSGAPQQPEIPTSAPPAPNPPPPQSQEGSP